MATQRCQTVEISDSLYMYWFGEGPGFRGDLTPTAGMNGQKPVKYGGKFTFLAKKPRLPRVFQAHYLELLDLRCLILASSKGTETHEINGFYDLPKSLLKFLEELLWRRKPPAPSHLQSPKS